LHIWSGKQKDAGRTPENFIYGEKNDASFVLYIGFGMRIFQNCLVFAETNGAKKKGRALRSFSVEKLKESSVR
jgi:hypothetical protein